MDTLVALWNQGISIDATGNCAWVIDGPILYWPHLGHHGNCLELCTSALASKSGWEVGVRIEEEGRNREGRGQNEGWKGVASWISSSSFHSQSTFAGNVSLP